MANRYWVGGTATWDGTAGTKWASSTGGAGGATAPGTTDDVFFDAGSGAATVTIAAGNACKSIDCTGFTGTLTGSGAIGISGNLTLVAGMTYSFTGSISFTGAGTLTPGGKTMTNAITFNPGAGNTYQLGGAKAGASATVIASGTWTTNNNNYTASTFTTTGTPTLNLGSSTLSISSTFTMASTATLNAGTSTINHTSSSGVTFTFGNETYNTFTMTLGTNGFAAIADTGTIGTFANLSVTCSTTAPSALIFQNSSSMTVTGTLTVTGNSASSGRVMFRAYRFGTGDNYTINAAAVSLTNCDFVNLTCAGAATWSGTSIGDCANNSGLTATAATTRFWVGNGGSWTNTARWSATSNGASGASMPLAQDTAIINAASITSAGQTISLDTGVQVLPQSIDFTGVANSPTLSFSGPASNGYFLFGSITLTASMTTSGTIGGNVINRGGTAGSCTINAAGKNFPGNWVFHGPGTISLGASISITTGFYHRGGTFDAVTYDVTVNGTGGINFDSVSSPGQLTGQRVLRMGSGTWTGSSTATQWNMMNSAPTSANGVTVDPGTSTIKFTNNSGSGKTFAGGDCLYNNFWIAGGGAGLTTINGGTLGCGFNNIQIDTSGVNGTARGIRIGNGFEIKFETITWTGTALRTLDFRTSSTSVTHVLTCTQDWVSIDYVTLRDSIARGGTEGAKFFAGANSTNTSGNINWSFTAAPALTGGGMRMAQALTTGRAFKMGIQE